MKPVVTVAKNTFKEIIRDRILYALIFFAIFLVILSYFLGQLSFAEQERIVADMGLMAIHFGCCLLAIFLGSTLVWKEIEKQTVLTLLSKPLSRGEFLIGKFLGLSTVLTLMNVVLSFILYLLCFTFPFFTFSNFLISQTGVLMESMFLLAVSIFFGVFCRPLLATLFAISIWMLGHGMNDLHFFSQKSKNVVFKNFGNAFSTYFINLERFNFREAVIYKDAIPAAEITKSVTLWLCWLAVLIFFGQRIFSKRDFV